MPRPASEVRLDIAGHVFRVLGTRAPARAWTRERYAPFLTTKRAGFTLHVRSSARMPRGRAPRARADWRGDRFRIVIASCRADGDLARRVARLHVPPMPSALSPSLFRALCSFLLMREGGFLLHASGVIDAGRAWVFCGPSDSGKTTLARLAAPRRVLNDETVAIVRDGRHYAAAATPFFGEGGPLMATKNGQAPLRAMFFLRHAAEFAHRRLTPAEAAARAWGQVFLPKRDPAVGDAVLGALSDFARVTPCFELAFRPTPEVWEYVDAIA